MLLCIYPKKQKCSEGQFFYTWKSLFWANLGPKTQKPLTNTSLQKIRYCQFLNEIKPPNLCKKVFRSDSGDWQRDKRTEYNSIQPLLYESKEKLQLEGLITIKTADFILFTEKAINSKRQKERYWFQRLYQKLFHTKFWSFFICFFSRNECW